MLEAALVGLIVAAAVAYAAWALLPAALRLRAAERIGRWADRAPRRSGLARMAAVLERNARARLGGCSNCSPGHDGSRRRSGTRRNPD
jgi:hypothetical protein